MLFLVNQRAVYYRIIAF